MILCLLLVGETMQKIAYVFFRPWNHFLIIRIINLWRVHIICGIKKGRKNEIWSGMMIETAYMKCDKGLLGMISIIEKPLSVIIWSNSHYVLKRKLQNLARFTEEYDFIITIDEQENSARVTAYQKDKTKIQKNFFKLHPPIWHIFEIFIQYLQRKICS